MLVGSTTACAFDGRRRGFILGGGAGGAATSFTREVNNPYGSGTPDNRLDGDELGFATDIKLGFGFNDQFLMYLDTSTRVTSPLENSMFGPAVSIYLRPNAPSAYVLAGFGFALFEYGGLTYGGESLSAGFGWEFSRHWSVEVTGSYRAGHRDEGPEPLTFLAPLEPGIETRSFSVFVTINGLAY
jgi:hypothetical protein